MASTHLPPLPSSWSALTWQQLCEAWAVKQHYGGNADVARAAALLALTGCTKICPATVSSITGESVYVLSDGEGRRWTVTPRQLADAARQALPWFDYPYGDPGEEPRKDGKGKVVKEGRDPVRGYVSPMRDALVTPCETVTIRRRHFALPQVACNNLTWQQYRSLQGIAPQLFAAGITDEQTLAVQAQFLAHVLTPRTIAFFDTNGGSIRLHPHYEYRYNAGQAEGVAAWIESIMRKESRRLDRHKATAVLPLGKPSSRLHTLFHVCFQAYQTALSYYAASYPLLFQDGGKSDPLKDALTGEVGTINTIMKYAGYAEQQQVYDSNLPFVLDILNTMTKEAKEIEKMNSKIKRK